LGFGGQKRLRAKSTGKGTGLRAQGTEENSKGFGVWGSEKAQGTEHRKRRRAQ